MKLNKQKLHIRIRSASAALALSSFMMGVLGTGCGPTSTGNPLVDVEIGTFVSRNMLDRIQELLAPSAYASVRNVTLCFKRLRFKKDNSPTYGDPDKDVDNINLGIGEVTLGTTGTHVAQVAVAAGTYRRIEFDLEDGCGSGTSLQVTNDNGTFGDDQRITIRFEGTFVVVDGVQAVTLGIQAVVTQLNSITADSQVKTQAEAASGSF